MCRLLGLTAGRESIGASFWLLDAPDSLEVQSRRNADGSGIGFFDPSGTPSSTSSPRRRSGTRSSRGRRGRPGRRPSSPTCVMRPRAVPPWRTPTRSRCGALRYPAQHALHIIERPAGASAPAGAATGGATAAPGLHVRSATSSVHAPGLQTHPSVVVASEELDGENGWRMMAHGELVHVRPDLAVESAVVISDPPARLVPLPAGNPNIDT